MSARPRIRPVSLLSLALLVGSGACSFDTSTTSGNGGVLDGAVPDAATLADDGGTLPDAAMPATKCLGAPYVLRSGSTHRYYLEETKMDFDSAQASCMAAGANLVVVNDLDEHNYVYGLGGSDPWMGYHDLDIEDDDNGGDSYEWVLPNTSSFTHWVGSEPNDGAGGKEDCAILQQDGWGDRKCSDDRDSVCECDPARLQLPPPACMSNPSYSPTAEGRRYRQDATPSTYAQASASCAADGAYLAVISDDAENDTVHGELSDVRRWIGLDDILVAGEQVWINGSLSTYENFNDGEPSSEEAGGLEDCVELRTQGDWNDLPCGQMEGFVCECDPLYRP